MQGIEIKSVIKLRIKASKAVAKILDDQSRKCNWLYNRLLELAQELRKQFIKSGDQGRRQYHLLRIWPAQPSSSNKRKESFSKDGSLITH